MIKKKYFKPSSLTIEVENEEVIADSGGDSMGISTQSDDEDGRFANTYRTNLWN